MGRREIIRVTCDVCGKTLDVRPDEVELTRYTVPVLVSNAGLNDCKYMRQMVVDLCTACAGRLAVLKATPITEMRYDPESFEERPFPTGRYIFEFGGDKE